MVSEFVSVCSKQRPLDSRTRTTRNSTRFNLKFFRVFEKNRYPGKLHCTFFSLEKIALLSMLKEFKPTLDRKMIKLLTFDNSLNPVVE